MAEVPSSNTNIFKLKAPSVETVGLKILCLSDTHDFQKGMLHPLPHADILVHAGDFTCRGSKEEVGILPVIINVCY